MVGGLRLGLGGFCLRHCAISSQWLNRSFASSPFSSLSSAVSFSSYRVSCVSSPSSRFTVSRLTRYSLYLSFRAVTLFSACHRWLTRRAVVLSHFRSSSRCLDIFAFSCPPRVQRFPFVRVSFWHPREGLRVEMRDAKSSRDIHVTRLNSLLTHRFIIY